MNRRDLIRHMVWMGAGIAFLPSCVYKQDQLSIQLKKIQITPDQEKLLFSLANAIIPPGDSPGAADLGAHLFALKMVDDCFNKEEQEKFVRGLKAMQDHLRKNGADVLNEKEEAGKLSLLKTVSQKSDNNEIPGFLDPFRRLVVFGYTQSEYVMTNLIPYKLIPGKYHGCVPVTTSTIKS